MENMNFSMNMIRQMKEEGGFLLANASIGHNLLTEI